MKPRTLSYSFVAIVLLTFPSLSAAQTKRALLIGINIYSPEGASVRRVSAEDKQVHRPDSRFAGTIAWPNLDGPERDVESMAAVLPDFGFTEIHQLTGQKATRGEILAELDKYIIEEPKTGDDATPLASSITR